MTFNSFYFFLLLPMVFLAFYFTKDQFRWLVLLAASYGFYATFKEPHLLLALIFVTIISYVSGLLLDRAADDKRRNLLFWMGTAGCLLVLIFIKYLPLLPAFGSALLSSDKLLITIGVSYFCLQAISYLADVYLEIQEAEKHLGRYAPYLAFFPKLLQGPIERGRDLLPQLNKKYEFEYDAMRSGMLLFTWGLFKKVVVADRLALYVNPVYNDVHAYNGLSLLVATYAYALQIYFDFAGYTDMARGTARMFGINLTENFNSPYLATSIAEFWRRWHISFSSWILDYIFKPLQMAWRDRGQFGTALALIVTFLFSGIWHGASWGFVIWGLLHGFYLAASTYYRPYQKKFHKTLGIANSGWLKAWQVFVTFNLVSFAWVFFRAKSLEDALYVVKNLININYSNYVFIKSNSINCFIILACSLATLLFAKKYSNADIFIKHRTYRWIGYYVLLLSILLFYVENNGSFIYFQF
jgi:D-alanyl-lipoteichoic acid acyltransferase DltB (MBOAT superfamily)